MIKVKDVTQPPFSSVGQLVFTMGDAAYEGTAFVVATQGIFTAAHNLYDFEEGTTANAVFFKLWVNGADKEPLVWELPLGKDDVTMPDEWIDDGDDNFDMAVCVIPAESFAAVARPLPVHDQLLREGLRFKSMAIGYQGDTMYVDESEATALDGGSVMAGDMVQGASGGPWIATDGTVYGVTGNADGENLSSPNNGPVAAKLIGWLKSR